MKRILCLLMLLSPCVQAASTSVIWEENAETDLAGYRIYTSPVSMLQTSTSEARNDSRVQITEVTKITPEVTLPLIGGVTTYIRMTAFDTSRNESGFNVRLSTEGGQFDDEIRVLLKRSDINNDGRVNVLDLGILAKELE